MSDVDEAAVARSIREVLFDSIQATASRDDDLEGSVLVGFLLVAEWRSGDGTPWLSKVSGDHSAPLPIWRQRGLAAEVVHDFWPDESEAPGSE